MKQYERIVLVQGDRYIKLILNDDEVISKWGKIGGKEQRTSHIYGFINKGKSNELSPMEAALADFERKMEKKIKEGYKLNSGDLLDISTEEKDTTLDFNSPQSSFTLSKPITKISDRALQGMIDKEKSILTEKENGMCHWVVYDDEGNVKIFTRRMNDHTRKYPDLEVEFYHMGFKNTLLAAEFVIDNEDHHKGFRLLQEISKSDTLKGELKENQMRSYELQQKNPVRACIFHIPYIMGEESWKFDYEDVHGLLRRFPHKDYGSLIFRPVNRTKELQNVEDVKDFLRAREKSLEGLVCWNKDGQVEVSFDGKPKRRAAYKIKVPKEMDVIAYGWNEGTGDRQGRIGSLNIGKYQPTRTFKIIESNMLDYGKVGSGIPDDMANPEDWSFPCVIEIEYEYHEPTGKFKFPRFNKIHEDKQPWECIREEGEAPDAKLVK